MYTCTYILCVDVTCAVCACMNYTIQGSSIPLVSVRMYNVHCTCTHTVHVYVCVLGFSCTAIHSPIHLFPHSPIHLFPHFPPVPQLADLCYSCTQYFSQGLTGQQEERFLSEASEAYAFGSNSSSQLAMGTQEKILEATHMPHMANCQVVSSHTRVHCTCTCIYMYGLLVFIPLLLFFPVTHKKLRGVHVLVQELFVN